MKNIAIIPARSGSKGLKDKNIKLLQGKPLMAYTIQAAIESEIFDCVHVSTDAKKYAQIAKEYGADVPFLRAEELADDTASTWDALRYVIGEYRKIGQEFDVVTLLQPTSPLRTAEDIRNANEIFVERQAESVISVCETEHSPLLCNTLTDSMSMNAFIDMDKVGRRQGLETYYRLNGAIYIQKTELLMNNRNLYGKDSYAYIMQRKNSIDIDDEMDFIYAEVLMKKIR